MGASASVKKAASDDSSYSSSDDDENECDGGAPIDHKHSSTSDSQGKSFALPTIKSPTRRKKKHKNFFTPEELIEIHGIEEMQKKATAFISNHFYYAVPVTIVRHSIDPYSPVFVQPDTNMALERVHASQLGGVGRDWSTVKSVPTTVMVTSKGKVVIAFEKTGVNYEVSIDNLMESLKKNSDQILDAQPPSLAARSSSSLSLSWDDLPDPPGLSQYVDVQFSRILRHKNKEYFKSLDKTVGHHNGVYDCDKEGVAVIGEPWQALVSKTWDSRDFTSFVFSDLAPGSCYLFRLRYRNHKGWSEYSAASRLYRTEPGAPASPVSPLSDAVMPHAVHLRWAPPAENNGADITAYVLEGRAVGDSFSVLFTGMRLSFVVFNLFPQAGYIFQVSAVNSFGTSAPSTVYSVLTPALLHSPPYRQDWRERPDVMEDYLRGEGGTDGGGDASQSCYANAQRCRDAWATHYDSQTTQMFYFNVLTGSRQLHVPNALLSQSPQQTQDGEDLELDDVALANERKKAFRTKRFRFIRDVHVNRKQRYKELAGRVRKELPSTALLAGGGSDVENGHLSSSAAMALAAPFTLPVSRESLLADTFRCFSETRLGLGALKTTALASTSLHCDDQCDLLEKLTRKLRVVFHQEAGIDAGGLGKEFFLLLSEQMVAYMSTACRDMIVTTECGKLFFNEDFCEEREFSPAPLERCDTSPEEAAAGGSHSPGPSRPRKGVISAGSFADLKDMHVRGDEFCQFFGRLAGKAIYDQQMLNLPLCGVLLAHIIGHTGDHPPPPHEEDLAKKKITPPLKWTDIVFSEDDLFDLDSALFKSLNWIRNNNPEGILDNTFTVTSKANKAKAETEVNLCKDGSKKEVTEGNKMEYVKLLEQWKTTFSVNTLLTRFLEGFWEIIPQEVIREHCITKAELDLIMNGKPAIDVEEIRAYTLYQGETAFSDNHPQVIQLWQIIRDFAEEDKRQFLFFVTGTSRVPLDGYAPAFNLTQGVGMQCDSLPRAHTCFNQLVLPPYSSLEAMREKLLFAIRETEGFQLS